MGNIISKAKAKTFSSITAPPAEKSATMSTPAFKHYAQAQSEYKPPQIAPFHHLGDLYSSDVNDTEKPITCGLYKFEAGKELVYEYTYHEMKVILEGEVFISDQTGQKVHAKAGDVFYFPKGSVITFETPTKGLAFFTGQRKEGGA